MSAVDDAIAEIDAQLALLAPQHEGLRDFLRLNLTPQAHQEVETYLHIYDRRVDLLHKAKAVLLELQSDGHPGIPPREVDQAVMGDLNENNSTIDAALAQFKPIEAVDLGLTAGAPVPK